MEAARRQEVAEAAAEAAWWHQQAEATAEAKGE